MKRILLLLCIVGLALPGLAQSRNAFRDVSVITDIFVTPSNGGLDYLVEAGVAPSFTFGGIVYEITDVFGFYVLSNDGSFVADHNNIGGWKRRLNNGGVGGVAGWHIPPGANNGINPGESFQFWFNSLNVEEVDQFGFHVRLAGEFQGEDTLFITVPEPATMTILGIGAAALLARRRRKS